MATRQAAGKAAKKTAKKPAKKTPKKSVEPKEDGIYQIKVELLGTRPPIWRRLLVPADVSLAKLNLILQAAMGWMHCHLHEFYVQDARYSDPEFELEGTRDEGQVTLAGVARKVGAKLGYVYDFGDGWEHAVTVEKILPRDPKRTYPWCVTGRRACPPEDCGGIWGYMDLLEILGNPKHPNHEEMMEWAGGPIDPGAFDVDELNGRLIDTVELMASLR